ncbi:hypothetical protein SAMN05216304_110110 [Bosea sp. OK403]|uniref:hypothetical protein n=1 Tax=Bosea sp. OK403 TaxID=1855286 RepID=UPI0008E810DC|nr:hypothetical protein [Bosea sp. OK403]SFJ61722.1 hypothetical protein SAMN05216304_110110 [Bosea sp. OK403]
MIIVLAVVALAAGLLATVVIWPYGPILAVLAAPLAASAVVLITALALAAFSAPRSSASKSGKDARPASVLLEALSRLMTR